MRTGKKASIQERKEKVGLIISARMGSRRLPGKALLKVGHRSLIGLMIERVKRSAYGGNTILATSESGQDDPLAAEAEAHGIRVFRGSEDDVVARLCQACEAFGVDVAVRLTGDCPLVDPAAIDLCVNIFRGCDLDLVTTKYNFPKGIDCEVLSYGLLKKILARTDLREDREHVTLYLWKNRKRFRGLSVKVYPETDYAHYVLTVDEEKDYERIKQVVAGIGEGIVTCNTLEIIDFLESNRHLIETREVPRGW